MTEILSMCKSNRRENAHFATREYKKNLFLYFNINFLLQNNLRYNQSSSLEISSYSLLSSLLSVVEFELFDDYSQLLSSSDDNHSSAFYAYFGKCHT